MDDVLRQLPIGFFIMLFGTIGLMIFSLVMLSRSRRKGEERRAQIKAAAKQAVMAHDMPTPDEIAMTGAMNEVDEAAALDLPDLASLVSVSAHAPTEKNTAVVTPAAPSDEMLTVFRGADGRFVVRADGRLYHDLPEGLEDDVRRILTGLKSIASEETAPSTAASAHQPDAESTAEAAVSAAAIPSPGALPKFTLPEAKEPPRFGRVKAPTDIIPEIDIARAIEDFLQHKLETTERFRGRSIHVRHAPGGGVAIDVDGRRYETVSDVDDEEVRAFLREMIEEWQASQ